MKKERFAWIESWCEETTNKDKPRVLLIGDSITRGYQQSVKEKLKDIAYVDYIATSYSIDMKIYKDLMKDFANDSKYDLIHFNNGLHGINLSKRSYKSHLEKVLDKLPKTKLILAKTTVVYEEGNKKFHKKWMQRVHERNEVVDEIAKQRSMPIDDLFSVSLSIDKENRYVDGTHYEKQGYGILATQVVEFIKNNL